MKTRLEDATRAADGAAETVLLWRVGAEWFGLPLAEVVEVTPLATITRRAGQRQDVLGWLDLGGDAVPVLDVGRLFGTEVVTPAASDRFIVLRVQGDLVALAVQEVSGIAEVRPEGDGGGDGVRPARVSGAADGRLIQLVDVAGAISRNRAAHADA